MGEVGCGMVEDTALGRAVVRSDPDRPACPSVHRILALEMPC
jgi:hypothetical protein